MNMPQSKLVIDEYSNNLKNRINDLLTYTDLFDCMIGYFYVTGFSKYVHNLNATDKIRILIGIPLKDEHGNIDISASMNAILKFVEGKTDRGFEREGFVFKRQKYLAHQP